MASSESIELWENFGLPALFVKKKKHQLELLGYNKCCEGVGTLLSSIIPECKEVTKDDEVGRNEDDETISRKS
jgi:hypothetical protein